MSNLFALASESERNSVNAILKEGRGGVRAMWASCDLFVVSVKCLNK